MAKQTFTTGQVLTAAQMTSLQQTAMGGGPATAKTANYVLVAADAGTTVAMNAAGSTTITVNTGLFAAGDTVFIQNLGAGSCTITAGTATVATAGSLILPQNDAGILYFTSTSAAIFYDYIQVGATSPLTTKGDIYVYGTSDTRLPVGTNGYTLVADSAETTGLKWAAPASGGMTQIATGTMSGSTFSLTSFSGYNNLQIVLRNYYGSVGGNLRMRLNNDTTVANYYYSILGNSGTYQDGTAGINFNNGATDGVGTNSGYNNAIINIFDYAQSSGYKLYTVNGSYQTASGTQTPTFNLFGVYESTSALTSVDFVYTGGGNNSGGTYIIYGVK
ncbi:hypothetical protein EB001_24835 [bacterium]|nr:hypothetical protein [bacterium]